MAQVLVDVVHRYALCNERFYELGYVTTGPDLPVLRSGDLQGSHIKEFRPAGLVVNKM